MECDFRTDIILIADDFYEAFKRCCEGKNAVQDGNVVKYPVCNVPAIVNGDFALELYFKSMLPPDTDGHKLMDLFNSLEENIKQEIKEEAISKFEKLAWKNHLNNILKI